MPRLSQAMSALGKMDARVVGRAAELAGEGAGTFAEHLGALSRATTEVIDEDGTVLPN